MSGYLNKATLIGNLGRDPEVRHSVDGQKIVNLSVATSEYWKDRNTGERKDKTEWHRVVIFNDRLADVAEQYLQKGSKIYIEGQLQTRKWTDQQGIERYSTEVVLSKFRGELTMLDSKSSGDSTMDMMPVSDAQMPGMNQASDNPVPSPGKESNLAKELEDDIPF